MSNKTADASARNPTQYNIEAIAKLEEEALDRRTAAERASDAIVKSIGSTPFLLLHVMQMHVLDLTWSPRGRTSNGQLLLNTPKTGRSASQYNFAPHCAMLSLEDFRMRRAVTHVGSPIHFTNTRRLLEAKKRPGPLYRLIETFAQSEIELCTSKDRASQFSNRNKKRDPAMIAADSSFALFPRFTSLHLICPFVQWLPPA